MGIVVVFVLTRLKCKIYNKCLVNFSIEDVFYLQQQISI